MGPAGEATEPEVVPPGAGGLPSYSIVTVTYGRPAAIRSLLGSLADGPFPGLERIVIVDDSPTPPSYDREFPGLPIDHVRRGTRGGISAAKNCGLARVRSELTFFVDDDNRVSPASVAGPRALLAGDRRLSAVAPATLYFRRPQLVWLYAAPFRPDRWAFDLIGHNRPRDPTLEGRRIPTDALPNASLVRTDAARAIGGFDESLPINSSADFCQRLKVDDHETVANTSAFVLHDVEPPGRPGYWAAHSSDIGRKRLEAHDWFLFQRRLHRGERALVPKCLVHAVPFLAAGTVASIIRPDLPTRRVVAALFRGSIDGLRDGAPSRPGIPIEPTGRSGTVVR